jgi:hypothetical protein
LEEQQQKMKWFFSQRKFSPLSLSDTMLFNLEISDLFTEPVIDGFATTISQHPVQEIFFILDEEIRAIEECQSIQIVPTKNKNVSIPIGKYKDNAMCDFLSIFYKRIEREIEKAYEPIPDR